MLFNVSKKGRRIFSVFFIAVIVLLLGVSAPAIGADDGDKDDDEGGKVTIPFAEARIIFETNFTDGDTGIQIFLDGEPWEKIEIKGPDGKLTKVENKGDLKKFGLTELFVESNEPNYDELSLANILALFPAGKYEFSGKTVEGDKLAGTEDGELVMLSHDLPCAPEITSPPEEDEVDPSAAVIIAWERVTNKINPGTESCGDKTVEIAGYQVIVENDHTFTIDLPADATRVTVPPEFLEAGGEYSVEVLAIAANGNQTITETEFSTE